MPHLKRSLNLPLVVLYGLGGTIGAGIYVLVGLAADRAGLHAPAAFVIAALVMAFTAASFSELAVRFPVTAGEAAYVWHGFNSKTLSLVIGLMVVTAGVVSAATVAIGSAGYIQIFLELSQSLIVTFVILAIGAIVCWGITESVVFASVLTLIEIVGLLIIVVFGFGGDHNVTLRLAEIVPDTFDFAVWSGVFAASLLAFFAFIGFEDIVNVAEEVERPERTLPLAIAITLIISTLLYLAVSSVAVLSVPLPELIASKSPLATVFERVTGFSPLIMSAVAIVATLNGMIIQMIMASRVLHGLAKQGQIPARFGDIHPLTQTPLFATLTVIGIVYCLAMFFPIETLAERTSQVTLTTFSVVNLALIRIKLRETGNQSEELAFHVPMWIPVIGVLTSGGLLLSSAL